MLGEALCRLHPQHGSVTIIAETLRRGVFDIAGFDREEGGGGRAGAQQGGAHDAEVERRAIGAIADRPGRWCRNARPRGGKIGGARRGRGRSNDDGQRQRRLFGDADFLAHQPRDLGAERHGGAGLGVGRCGHIAEQPDRALIAEVHEPADGKADRIGPLQHGALPTGRERPVKRRRLADIAGVEPIGVPAGADDLFERDGHRAARRDGVVLGNQARMHLGQVVDLRRGG